MWARLPAEIRSRQATSYTRTRHLFPHHPERISAPTQGLGVALIETEGTKVFVHVRRADHETFDRRLAAAGHVKRNHLLLLVASTNP